MKFHIVFVLLVVFGAAQAGKKHEALTFGSGYKSTYGEGETFDDEDDQALRNERVPVGALSAAIINPYALHSEEGRIAYDTSSQYYANKAEGSADLSREKKQMHGEYHGKAATYASRANEAYKKSQLHKRQAKDKQAIAKEYEERAQKHESRSKALDVRDQDDERKSVTEMEEYARALKIANLALVFAGIYQETGRLQLEATNVFEQFHKMLSTKGEEYKKQAEEYKEKANKEKEEAAIQQAKSKELNAKAQEYENIFIESSKKLAANRYYELEFKMKAENERHHAELARIRSRFLSRLANYNREQAEAVLRFARSERKDGEIFRRNAIELYKETRALAATAARVMKQHRYTGQEIYTKQPFPHSNYHGA
uniref:Mantis fibroin 2 n=1 Tax=Archimantis monstrosa TaxID=1150998 RepID=I3PM95_9NEOP|nr:mantis fibroin 2 [Archimantis monstrosa]